MGCFDANCCLTGLPMHQGDPVRAALILRTQSEEQMGVYSGMNWRFWTPPVKSIYNDYGNIHWDKISESQREVLEFFIKMSLESIKDHDRYSKGVFKNKNISLEEIWNACFHQDVDFYLTANKKRNLSPWMCHDWAWQALMDMCPCKQSFVDDVENSVKDVDIFNRNMENSFSSSRLTSENGCFLIELIVLLRQLKLSNKLKSMLVDTFHLYNNMYLVRKSIAPLTFVGEQYEQFEHFGEWTQLIADKVQESIKKREED